MITYLNIHANLKNIKSYIRVLAEETERSRARKKTHNEADFYYSEAYKQIQNR